MENIRTRNLFVRKFFQANNISVSLLGEAKTPLIVTDANLVLSCAIIGFEIVFFDRWEEALRKEVFRVKLRQKPLLIEKKILQWMLSSIHKKVYVFADKDSSMFLAYWSKREDGIYPVFSPFKDVAYYTFKRQKAIEKLTEFSKIYNKLSIIY